MRRRIFITLLALNVSLVGLYACGKADDAEPVSSEAVETPEQQEEIEEETIVEEDIIEEEPEQEIAEADTEDEVQEIESDIEPVEEAAEDTDEPTEQIDVETMDKIMYVQSEVNTRLGDSTDYEKVGSLTTNQEVHVIGQSNSTGWYQVDIDGAVVFVSDKYLADSKVEVQQQQQQTTTITGQAVDPRANGAGEQITESEAAYFAEAEALWAQYGDEMAANWETFREVYASERGTGSSKEAAFNNVFEMFRW